MVFSSKQNYADKWLKEESKSSSFAIEPGGGGGSGTKCQMTLCKFKSQNSKFKTTM